MKHQRLYKAILGLTVCLLVAVSMLGWAHVLTPETAAAVEYPTLTDVRGRISFGASALADPVLVTTNRGYYLSPRSYVYLGGSVDNPILFRVLDADADNTGRAGAVFLFAEDTRAWGEERYSPQSTVNDWMEWENIYQMSYPVMYGYQTAVFENSYRDWTETDPALLPTELDFLRPIVKNDDAAAMNGMYGYGTGTTYQWIAPHNTEYNGVTLGNVLDNAYVFPLSVEELVTYVGNYNGAPGLGVAGVSYWTRTALNDKDGNLVGVVRETGTVDSESAFAGGIEGRYATNLELAEIAFLYAVDERNGAPVYRITLNHPIYKDTETPFTASVKDVKGSVLTVAYDNAVYTPTGGASDEEEYLSVMITDEGGAVTYYGSVKRITRAGAGEASFTLPADFDRENDRVSVFVESRGGEKSVSYVSNTVTLDCVHDVGVPADCMNSAVCGDCGESYGNPDRDAHIELGDYVIDERNLTHERFCTACGASAGVESCTFGAICSLPCKCGSVAGMSEEHHDYDTHGLCLRDPSHTRPFVGSDGFYQDIEIGDEGQFLSFAKYVNAGGGAYRVDLLSDLDFSGIDFIPVGSAEHPFEGFYFDGGGHTVTGITHSDPDGVSALFAYAEDVSIENLTVRDCSFAGRVAAVLVGVGNGIDNAGANLILSCTVTGGETAGAVIADATDCVLRATGAFDVTDGEGDYVPFFGAGNSTVGTSSWYLADETDAASGAWTLEDVASGALAWSLGGAIDGSGRRVSQRIGTESYPVYRSENAVSVLMAETCGGERVYFNDPTMRETLEAHTYTRPVGETAVFVWDEVWGDTCTVAAICGVCGHEGTVAAQVEPYYYLKDDDHINTIIRTDYIPRVTLGGVEYVGEARVVISVPIESVIGMTPMETVYDGYGVDPDDLMTNHKLWGPDDTSVSLNWQYEAWFVNEAGEELRYQRPDWDGGGIYSLNAVDAGSYDLVVDGRNAFVGQRAVYEDVLVIKPATVTVTPYDVRRPVDGTKTFDARFDVESDTTERGDPNAWIDVRYSDADAATVGAYESLVTVTCRAGVDPDSINIVLRRERVTCAILPAWSAELTEVTYPTQSVYGDAIPVPTPAQFGLAADAEVQFAWYKYVGDMWLDGRRVAVSEPRDVGEYVLTVLAAPAEGYAVATYYEHAFSVTWRTPTIELILPEGVTLTPAPDEYSNPSVTLTAGQSISAAIGNLAAWDTQESAYIRLDMELDRTVIDAIPTAPTGDEPYRIVFRAVCNPIVGYGSYESTSRAIDVYVLPDPNATPEEERTLPAVSVRVEDALTTDAGRRIPLTVEWEYVPDGEFSPRYTVRLLDSEGEVLESVRANRWDTFGEEHASYTFLLERVGDYTVEILHGSFDHNETTLERGIPVSLSLTRDGTAATDYSGMGRYVLTMDADGEVTQHPFTVRKPIVLWMKECEFNVDGVSPSYEKERVVTTADSTFARGHELVGVAVEIEDYDGEIRISAITVRDSATGEDVSDLYAVDAYVSGWSHVAGGYNVCHFFDSACDDTCDFCDYSRAAAHRPAENANCLRGAICADCGMICTPPEPNRHVMEGTVIYPNREDLSTHAILHVCCGGVAETHAHTEGTAATCHSLAACADCGWLYGELDGDAHTLSVRYEVTEEGHDAIYDCCGKREREAHAGTGEKTCLGILCTDCGAYYGEKDPTVHAGSATFAPAENGHTVTYACCSAVVNEAHAGGSATCTERALCTDCGTAYGEVDAHAHTSTETRIAVSATNASIHEERYVCCGGLVKSAFHTGGVADCHSAAVCTVCSAAYGTPDPSNHASEETVARLNGVNPLFHDVCRACCGEILSSEAHTGGEASCTHGTVCDVCGTDYGTPIEHTYAGDCDAVCDVCGERTRAAAFHTDADGDGKCDVCGETVSVVEKLEENDGSGSEVTGDNTVMVVVGYTSLGVSVAGVSGFSLWWFVIKKKKWLDLFKPFLK